MLSPYIIPFTRYSFGAFMKTSHLIADLRQSQDHYIIIIFPDDKFGQWCR